MRKHKLIPAAVVLGVVLLILLLFGAGQGGDDPASVELLPEHVPGELLVKFKPRLASGAVLSSPAIAGVTTIRTIPGIGARLDQAWLEGANLDRAQLQGANLDGARLQHAILLCTQLQGSTLRGAQLQSTLFFEANLQGAFLIGAQLQSACLGRVQYRARI